MVSTPISLLLIRINLPFLLANLATKKRIQQKMNRIKPFPQFSSNNSTPTARTNSVAATPRESVPIVPSNAEVKPTYDQKDIETAVELSPPELVSNKGQLNMTEDIHKSLSQKIIQYLSSKMNHIVPEDTDSNAELQQLELLQAGGRFNVEVEESGIIAHNVENEEM